MNLVLCLAACLVSPLSLFSAPKTGGDLKYTTNLSERLECEKQLNKIYGALASYRMEHEGEYPEKLQALYPEYIADQKLLVCPHATKRGGLKEWKKTTKELSTDFYTSYGYELGTRPLEYHFWRGVPRKTFHDYKSKLAQKFPKVPIVRCHDHRPFLNLASDGEIYESDTILWEKKYNLEDRVLAAQQIYALPAPQPLSMNQFSPRDPRLNATALDLVPYYNGLLTNSWQGFPGNDLASLQAGFHEIDGTQFDIRGVIQLAGVEVPTQFPTRIDGIKVGQKCTRLHFIHAASRFSHFGTNNGFYVLNYSDGQKREIPLIYGRDIADWWPDPREVLPTDATIAWSGQNAATQVYGKSIQLFHSTFVNVLPDVEISTISFTSRKKHDPVGTFVVAITLDQK